MTLAIETIAVPMVHLDSRVSQAKDEAMQAHVDPGMANSIHGPNSAVRTISNTSRPRILGHPLVIAVINYGRVALGERNCLHPHQY